MRLLRRGEMPEIEENMRQSAYRRARMIFTRFREARETSNTYLYLDVLAESYTFRKLLLQGEHSIGTLADGLPSWSVRLEQRLAEHIKDYTK